MASGEEACVLSRMHPLGLGCRQLLTGQDIAIGKSIVPEDYFSDSALHPSVETRSSRDERMEFTTLAAWIDFVGQIGEQFMVEPAAGKHCT